MVGNPEPFDNLSPHYRTYCLSAHPKDPQLHDIIRSVLTGEQSDGSYARHTAILK